MLEIIRFGELLFELKGVVFAKSKVCLLERGIK